MIQFRQCAKGSFSCDLVIARKTKLRRHSAIPQTLRRKRTAYYCPFLSNSCLSANNLIADIEMRCHGQHMDVAVKRTVGYALMGAAVLSYFSRK